MTGKAGSGKSTFLKYIKEHTRKRHVVLAPTGIAAVNVGGSTLHSFFKIPFKPLLPDDPDFASSRIRKRLKYSKAHAKLIHDLELVIIDEISMVRADIIDFVDKVLRVYSGNMREPFGGKQMLFVGDIFQLEPVVTADMRDVLRHAYRDSYFFSANVFADFAIVPIELKKIYRQSDSRFIGLLDRIRVGAPTDADVATLNARVAPDYVPSPENFVMTLATRRDMVDAINDAQLARLKSKEITYKGSIVDDFPENSLPTAKELTLKVGAQVVFVRNDREKRWVNGTLGRVSLATDDLLEVELENGERACVEREIWENITYRYDEERRRVTEKVIGTFTQFPVRLAWALTIHKSQGLTFNNVVIDIGRGAFSGGQTYVALSRCRSLEGIALRSTINPRDVFVNPSILNFSNRFNSRELIGDALENATADDAYCRSAAAFDRGDIGSAVDFFAKAAAIRPELAKPSVTRLLKRKLSIVGKLKTEIETLKRQLDDDRRRFGRLSDEYVALGRDCLDDYDDLTAAIANFDKAISLNNANAVAWHLKGLALSRAGSGDDAVAALRRARSLDEGDLSIIIDLADVEFARGDLHEALNSLLFASQRFKKRPEIHSRLADLYEKIGDEESAYYHRQIAESLKSKKRK